MTDAVAASCASGLPYRIDDIRYIDGGYRSNAENAHLAAGYGRVLVLSPFGGKSLTPLPWGVHLATQIAELRAEGSTVETIFPEEGSEHLFGVHAMNLSLRPLAARAGYEQGTASADYLAEFWRRRGPYGSSSDLLPTVVEVTMTGEPKPFDVYEPGVLLHGTKADLALGDLLVAGRDSNFEAGRRANHVYLTETLDAATGGAELAVPRQSDSLLPHPRTGGSGR
ncbi:Rifampin ADP-ribosyl transferase [Cryobacterium flavum]|uniref:Rifampin ADP-ribosyl transferase n=1 Tax=Cryobacterium flavum TaxID=1424659 RepID=A0A5E9G3T3_9MICO|nr:Rifampin ADP-ribosyl transferase [Cryobacterium flavum]